MNKKVLISLCIFLIFDAAFSGKLRKKEDLEEVYGNLEDEDPNLQKDEGDYYDGEIIDTDQELPGEAEEINVKILSEEKIFTNAIGDTVLLPCQVAASKADPVRLWNKGSLLLFQSSLNITDAKNLKLYNNGTLALTIQDESDAGDYKCSLILSSQSKAEVIHKVELLRAPKIESLVAADNKTLLSLGDDLTLTCQASGTPKPKITWHKGNKRLGTEGETLTIQNVDASHAGSYRCLADNKIGNPAHKPIDIVIQHAPIINVEKFIVNSDHKKDAELVCNVNAYPASEVTWQKDNINLFNNEPKIKLSRQDKNKRNILIIRDLNENDFGKYTCVAINDLGKQDATIQLVKQPVLNNFNKSIHDNQKDVILEWKVESKQPVLSHELQYRRKGESKWITVKPEVVPSDNDMTYLLKHTLMRLEPGTYETRAKSQNSHGWSEFSDIMPFDGAKHHSYHHKSKHNKNKEQKVEKTAVNKDATQNIPAQQRTEEIVKESTSSSQTIETSIPLIALIIFINYFHFYYH